MSEADLTTLIRKVLNLSPDKEPLSNEEFNLAWEEIRKIRAQRFYEHDLRSNDAKH